MDTDKIFKSKLFKGLVLGILVLIAILLILKIGMFIGARKAGFSRDWSDNYRRNFGGPEQEFMTGFADRGFMEASGVFGQIIKINFSTGEDKTATIIIKGRDDVERIILADNKTIIRSLRETIGTTNLKVNDYVIVIGEPNSDGQIEAKFIRIMPAPEASFNPSFNRPL
jgi:hypothetical protein